MMNNIFFLSCFEKNKHLISEFVKNKLQQAAQKWGLVLPEWTSMDCLTQDIK